MPLTTYQKLSIEDWLPATLDRVLWLDCDTLVLSDPGPLWALSTDGRIALAATDLLVPRLGSRFGVAAWHELGFDPHASYFNAGVMLIDLERWRRENVAERAADYLRQFGKRVVFWDQEALNAALAGRWSALDPRWNRNPMLHHLFAGSTSAPGERDDTWIAHFSGRLKPWTHPQSSRYQDAFEAHLDETSWAGWRPPRTWRNALLARYAGSSLRRRLFPLEQQWTFALHALTRRRSS
jgi:lipopolysaccharide biosynthesis glycosyltransferase